MVDWPKRWMKQLAEPAEALPASLERLRQTMETLDARPALTAYAKDKNPARYAPRST
jgi:hypothetical protein